MGNQNSTPEEVEARKKNKKIEIKNLKDYKVESNKIKLLLLGTGESGKSTLVKQMRNLYGAKSDQSEEENRIRRFAVYSTVFQSMAALLKATDDFVPIANPDLQTAKETIINKANGLHGSFKEANLINEEVKNMCVALWNDEGVRETWSKHRSHIQAQASLEYFLESADRIFSHGYVVTEEDWLRTRVRTTGVLTEEFTVDKVTFNVWDVGGQRNERKKWIHCFSQVTSVIFVVAVNEYDEFLFEDNNVNRMIESLNLFDEMVNHPQFVDSGMILFLNKSDLFREKLTRIPIKHVDPVNPDLSRWEDFEGPHAVPGMNPESAEFKACYDAGIEYFTERFCNLNQHPSTKEIYVHVTCAMDKRNVHVVFSACRDIILRQVLSEQGFVRD